MKFEAVDTEELKNLEISVDGTQGIFKIGEGEANHYQIPNDKKLWESQLMIVCKDGKYFIRDLGVVHTSRIKVDMNTQIQIQQDALIDLGKVVHYHFDKVTHKSVPNQEPKDTFFIMRPNASDYNVEEINEGEQDPPTLRARPTWVSSDENKDLIQKEIILEAIDRNHYFSIGRSMRREVQIKLKAVSADHCNITYEESKGWFISESGKDKASSNGTFVFMKSQKQMQDHEPSSLIPLHDGMVLSFINYEIRVNLEKKDQDVLDKESTAIHGRIQEMQQSASAMQNLGSTMPAQNPTPVVEEPVTVEAAQENLEEAKVAEKEAEEKAAKEAAEAEEAARVAEAAAALAEKERAEAEAAAKALEEAAELAEKERAEAEAAKAKAALEADDVEEAKDNAEYYEKAAEAQDAVADAAEAKAEVAEEEAKKEDAEADTAEAEAAAAAAVAEKERAEAEAIKNDATATAAEKAKAE